MTIRVATVLSAREWEPGLVAHARDTAALRIVLRAYQPSDIETRAEDIDVVVAGGGSGGAIRVDVPRQPRDCPDRVDDLPVGSDDKVNRFAEGIEDLGVIRTDALVPGATVRETFDLPAGNYALICNIPGHYVAGMFTAFVIQ
ncbi:MAG: hypothetical protein IIB87_02225 [Chloroflexi bacterium]|nr:hypothetical protein [Chloroflexota bacterium]